MIRLVFSRPKYQRRRLVGNLKNTPSGMIKFCAQVNELNLAIILYPKQDEVRSFLFSGGDNFSEYIKFKENALGEKLRKNTHK